MLWVGLLEEGTRPQPNQPKVFSMMTKGKEGERIEFPVPKGFTPPEGSEGGEFDLVCTLKVKPDGKTMCITKLGDMDMPGYDEDEGSEETERPDYKSMAKGVMAGLQPASGEAENNYS